jgi:hypothetical protein
MARFAQTGFGARTWALRLSCGVVVEAAEKALCDRISGLVRMVRSPWGQRDAIVEKGTDEVKVCQRLRALGLRQGDQ